MPDVLMIQGILRYLNNYSADATGLGSEFPLPEMTGFMDLETSQAINQFQIVNAHALIMPFFDGLIESTKYKHRVLRRFYSSVPVMTITYMHHLCTDAALMNGDTSYIDVIKNMDVRILDDVVINY